MTARSLLALALGAAACSSQTIGQAFDLKTPVALVPFNGYTRYDPALHGYVAVASMQGDELRVFDPLENRAVSSPGFSFALSVPTDPRPVLLASASLGEPAPGADLLVVASAGEQSIQLVDTWETDPSAGMHVVSSVDLRPAADPGTEIVAMIGVPSFVAGTAQVDPGKARILVAFSRATGSPTARLATVEFQRGPDGKSIDGAGATVRSVAVGFEAESLSRVWEYVQIDPAPPAPVAALYPHLVFAATPDIVTGTDGRSALGVAQIDLRASDPAQWAVKAVDAGAPTRLVAAAVVGERYPDVIQGVDAGYRRYGPGVLRAYADLDSAGCGPSKGIACGIATLDPLANPPGLAAEIVAAGTPGPVLVPNQPYRAPMALPGVSLAMAVALPPVHPGAGTVRSDPDAKGAYRDNLHNLIPYKTDDGAPLMRLSPFTGQLWTTAALVVASSTGSSYVLDLGGSAAPNDVSLLADATSKLQVKNGQVLASYVVSDATPILGLWDSQGTPTDTSTDPTVIDRSIQVTPGFTHDDSWTLTWQGTLPSFAVRHAVVGRAGGAVYVAFETPMTDAGGNVVAWSSSTNLPDPALGIHVLDGSNPAQEPGDVVEVFHLDGSSRCLDASGNPVLQDTRAVAFVPPAPALPPADPASAPGGALSLGATVPGCIDPGAADGAYYRALVSVRAFGLVLVGASAGYAGRPQLDATGPGGSAPPSSLKWEDEQTLVAACSPANRAACEHLSVVRKARRFYYPLDSPCAIGSPNCHGTANLDDPLVPGPALAFRVGKNPAAASGPIGRGVAVVFSTQSGVSPMSRVPTYESVPNAAIAVDRTSKADGTASTHSDEGTWFYLTYTGNTVFGFGPGLYVGTAVSLR